MRSCRDSFLALLPSVFPRGMRISPIPRERRFSFAGCMLVAHGDVHIRPAASVHYFLESSSVLCEHGARRVAEVIETKSRSAHLGPCLVVHSPRHIRVVRIFWVPDGGEDALFRIVEAICVEKLQK